MLRKIKKSLSNLLRPDTPESYEAPAAGKSNKAPHPTGTRDDNKPPSSQGGKKRRSRGGRGKKSNQDERIVHPNASSQHRKTLDPPVIIEPEAVAGKSRFIDFQLDRRILGGLQDMGFEYGTPIQTDCLPHSLAGRDVTGKAQTGTGKTAAFLITVYNHLLNNPLEKRHGGHCRALVLAPTRELAIQIHKDAEAIGKYCGCENLVVFGGMGHREQRQALTRAIDILVATPGRLLDYMRNGDVKLDETEILVIDEADRMLDMGFIPDVKSIVSRIPRPGVRRTMFFSATLTSDVTRLIDRWLKDPVTIEIEPENIITDLIRQRFYAVTRQERLPVLLWVLRNEKVERMLVFVNRRDMTYGLRRQLEAHGFKTECLSGDVEQRKRMSILERFRSGETKVVVATDVAARGIHVDDISHVVNYDLPEQPEDYVHRIGRTGRAGQTGDSIAFLDEYGSYMIPDLEKLVETEIKSVMPSEEMLELPKPVNPAALREPCDGLSGGNSRGSRGRSGGGPRGGGSSRSRRR